MNKYKSFFLFFVNKCNRKTKIKNYLKNLRYFIDNRLIIWYYIRAF